MLHTSCNDLIFQHILSSVIRSRSHETTSVSKRFHTDGVWGFKPLASDEVGQAETKIHLTASDTRNDATGGLVKLDPKET